jgi:hypothetical protein
MVYLQLAQLSRYYGNKRHVHLPTCRKDCKVEYDNDKTDAQSQLSVSGVHLASLQDETAQSYKSRNYSKDEDQPPPPPPPPPAEPYRHLVDYFITSMPCFAPKK